MTNLRSFYKLWSLRRDTGIDRYYEPPTKEERKALRRERRRVRAQLATRFESPAGKPRQKPPKPRPTARLTWVEVRSKNNPTSKAVHYEPRIVQV